MIKLIGHVRKLLRYPVKSMSGISMESASLGWHGVAGDRRLAFRRVGEDNGFPWLTASRLPELLLYQPSSSTAAAENGSGEYLPAEIITPAGKTLGLRSPELRNEIAARLGTDVELMHLKHGIFDDALVSLICLHTIGAIGKTAGVEIDHRRFRPNIVLEAQDNRPFVEDDWVGGTIVFGDDHSGPAICVTARDLRCSMINLDPDTAASDPRIMKATAALNENHAGIYATVVRTGTIRTGDPVRLE